jgi:hypothetical protein
MTPANRSGYALLSVLWIMVLLSTASLALTDTAKHALLTSTHRLALQRLEWAADGCIAYVREHLDRIGPMQVQADGDGWVRFDRVIASVDTPDALDCTLMALPTGVTANINTMPGTQLHQLLVAAGIPTDAADSVVSARNRWMRVQDSPPGQARPFPSVARFVAEAGTGSLAIAHLLGVEEIPLSLNHAPPELLRWSVGLSGEAVDAVMAHRERGQPLSGYIELARQLTEDGEHELVSDIPRLLRTTTVAPFAWDLEVRSGHGAGPALVVRIRFARAATGDAGVVARRVWIE